MSDNGVQRDLGRLDAQVDELIGWRDEMREWCKQSDATQAQILAKLNKAEGGLRLLLGVGSVAGAVGSGLTWLVTTIRGG